MIAIHRLHKRMMDHKQLYIMLIPGLIFFIIYKYLPMWGLVLAFKDYYPALGLTASKWVGLKHFNHLFHSSDFWEILRNTLVISFSKLVFDFPAPIILALLLNELSSMKFKRTVQTLIYMPHFLSWIILGGIVMTVLSPSGLVNYLIEMFGGEKILFLTTPGWFVPILVLTEMWKHAGWGTIIYLAAISGIDPGLYDAAKADGANRFWRLWHVTLPSIRSVIVILLILRLGNIMDVGFQQILVLYNPAVYEVGDVIGTYVYRVGILKGQYSFTTAVGLFNGVVGLLLVVAANRASKKLGQSGIW